jgi:hypothetical protein
MANKQKWSMVKMTKKLEAYCAYHGYDIEDIGFYTDTETENSYIWNCESPNGKRFKVITLYHNDTIVVID